MRTADTRRPLGRILTFYSYKGGTGRSMVLANIAWILASAGRRVLMIDWDLEAPGLHRYFRPFLLDDELSASDGVIDIVERYANEAIRPPDPNAPAPSDWYLPFADFTDDVLSIDYGHFATGGRLDFLPAGRQSDAYAVKVSSFNWQNLYDRLGGGGFFEAMKRRAREEYDYILIDSRTGVSDTAGICSVQMPDTLVVCFTYNNQSIKGASGMAAWATQRQQQLVQEYRSRAAPSSDSTSPSPVQDSLRPYRIFPIPMRVDDGETDRLTLRQTFARDRFRPLLAHLGADREDYLGLVEVPNKPIFAYEEVLAPFKENAKDPKSALSAFVRIASYITDRDVSDYRLTIAPEERQRILEAFAAVPGQASALATSTLAETEEESLVRAADAAIASFMDNARPAVRRVFARLVRLDRDEEGGALFPIRAALADFSDEEQAAIAALERQGLLSVTSDSSLGRTVAIADSRLLARWKTLIGWLSDDREFLLWRQQLRSYLADWDRTGREDAQLLSGTLLDEAQMWLKKRPGDLNRAEQDYVARSATARRPPPVTAHGPASSTQVVTVRPAGLRVVWITAAIAAVVAVLIGAYVFAVRRPATQPLAITAAAQVATDPLEQVLLLLELGSNADVPPNVKDLAIELTTKPIPFAVLHQENHPITTTRFSGDGRQLLVGSSDGSVSVWQTGGVQRPIVIPTSVGSVVSLSAAEGGKSMLVTGGNHVAQLWDISVPSTQSSGSVPIVSNLLAGTLVGGLPVIVQPRNPGSGRPSGIMVIAQAIRTRLETVTPSDFKELAVLPDATELVIFSANGASVAAEAGGRVSTWSLPSGYTGASFTVTGRFRAAALSPNGAYVAVASDESVSIWSLNGRPTPNWVYDLRKSDGQAISSPSTTLPETVMAVSSDGNVVALAFADLSTRLIVGRETPTTRPSADPFAVPTGARVFRGHKNGIVDVTFSGDGTVVATAGADGTVRLWENQVGRTLTERPSASSSWSELWNRLRSETTACLTVSDRMRLLNESESSARSAALKCETDNVLKSFSAPPRS